MAPTKKLYAALTGDVIKSSRLDPGARRKLSETLLASGEELRKSFPGLVVDGINLFRGDSVQFLIDDPSKALRAALFFRAALKASGTGPRTDMRLAIGVGTIDFMPESARGGADGEAYRLSGPALDSMGTKQTLCLALPRTLAPLPHPGTALKATVVLTGVLAQRWTAKQALAVKGALCGQTQEEICQSWPTPVTRQAVAKHLDAAGWFGVEQALAVFEDFGFTVSEE
ncbi:MAG: hypothetical protein JXB25_13140 [Deltaproteobacteria bacterium]|nr:hypothetical protein [Deltaproteobacteria bacterium]